MTPSRSTPSDKGRPIIVFARTSQLLILSYLSNPRPSTHEANAIQQCYRGIIEYFPIVYFVNLARV